MCARPNGKNEWGAAPVLRQVRQALWQAWPMGPGPPGWSRGVEMPRRHGAPWQRAAAGSGLARGKEVAGGGWALPHSGSLNVRLWPGCRQCPLVVWTSPHAPRSAPLLENWMPRACTVLRRGDGWRWLCTAAAVVQGCRGWGGGGKAASLRLQNRSFGCHCPGAAELQRRQPAAPAARERAWSIGWPGLWALCAPGC